MTVVWAVALIRPLAWERPYAVGAALKSKTKQNKSVYQSILLRGFVRPAGGWGSGTGSIIPKSVAVRLSVCLCFT